MASSSSSQADQIRHASKGFGCLLNNELEEANRILGSEPDSTYHLCGLGLVSFLTAALAQEDQQLYTALGLMSRAEAAATAAEKLKRPKNEPVPVFPAGTEFKLLIADTVICQALVHVLTESYVEFMKAIYKLNRSYKGFTSLMKVVYPVPITEKQSLADVFATLNRNYAANLKKAQASTSAPSSSSSASSFLGWGSRKRPDLEPMRASSTTVLPDVARLKDHPSDKDAPTSSVPNTRPPSRNDSIAGAASVPTQMVSEDGKVVEAPLWEGDALSSIVIAGTSFGNGLFGLIFSILPPKARKLISWFGFSNNNRSIALKLLNVAAATHDDVHGFFASLALVTFYCLVLLMSGWQADEQLMITQCAGVLDRVVNKFPQGTLWILNRAKVERMRGNIPKAIEIIETALAEGTKFREADSLLVFELGWCLLANAEWEKAADAFVRMKDLNNWSWATYVWTAAGALLQIHPSKRTPEQVSRIAALFEELPSLMTGKRLLGEPPSTEMFISRKLTFYKAKHARWVASGRLNASSNVWDTIFVTPATELGLVWSVARRAPHDSLQQQIDRLSSFTPAPRHGPAPLDTQGSSEPDQLDSVEEVATRDLVLGVLYRALGNLPVARAFLQAAIDTRGKVGGETWVSPFATFELAGLECQELDLAVSRDGQDAKSVWKKGCKAPEALIDSIFTFPEYDLKSRLESRTQMLRDQVTEKKAKLGLV